jgi:hypothetical protein
MKDQNGSAVMWILIGILLFAALGVAMMSGSRTSGNMITGEKARTTASGIIGFGNEMKMTIQRLKYRGCSEAQFGFDNSIWQRNSGAVLMDTGHNPSTPGDQCRVFNIAGGGLTPMVFAGNGVPETPLNIRSGHSYVYSISVHGVGTAANDLVMITQYVDKDVCTEINKKLGIAMPLNVPPDDNFAGAVAYAGLYTGTGALGDTATQLVGHSQGCFHFVPGGVGLEIYDYHFYQVLLAR